MREADALLQTVTMHAGDDTPRLVYADWLDEHAPDRIPSPAAGPSARAEFIRVQCRLARGAVAEPDYPELLEREIDLADWLNTHNPDRFPAPALIEAGEWGAYRRGFGEIVEFEEDWEDDPAASADKIAMALEEAFAEGPGRTLRLEDAMAEEVALLSRRPIFGDLHGLYLDFLGDGVEDQAVRAIATSRYATGLKRLFIDFSVGKVGYEALAASPYLGNMEALALDYPPVSAAMVRTLGRAKWFRNLRYLQLCLDDGDVLRALADLPLMPRLVSLTLRGSADAGAPALRRFAASAAFPRLAYLDATDSRLTADQLGILARGPWPLRHLRLGRNQIRRAGCEAIAGAAFARSLRVLDLRGAEITTGGAQTLAAADSLAGLRHLDLAENPIGPGGLATIAASPFLRGLRALDLSQLNSSRAPITSRDVAGFLAALEMPGLRHLHLNSLPVGIRGAKLIATRPLFHQLTRLALSGCAVAEAGTKALIGSKRLAQLVELDLSGNKVGKGAAKLASRKVLPRLAHCRLGMGTPKSIASQLRRRPGVCV